MSGTSMDAVDVALCQIDSKKCTLRSSLEFPFPQNLKVEILELISGECSLARVGKLDHRLGSLFADAVNVLLLQERMHPSEIKAIGSHGQTVWHQPSGEYPFSMQLGDPNIIAVNTGVPVVADFRRKDMALGGQGAPFAPAFHQFLFGNLNKRTAVVNIGGMANISILGEPLLGYDTGPGNVLMDAWISKAKGQNFDEDGVWAASGRVNEELLEKMLNDPYFTMEPPKSTGREKFGLEWVERLRNTEHGTRNTLVLLPEDIQRMLLELTAVTIADEVRRFDRELVLLCGGGAKNSFLLERLKVLLPDCEVVLTDDYGVSGDFMEAMAFAWLAYKRMHREVVLLKSVTGAKENSILGALYV